MSSGFRAARLSGRWVPPQEQQQTMHGTRPELWQTHRPLPPPEPVPRRLDAVSHQAGREAAGTGFAF